MNLDDITAETLAQVRKAQTAGWNSGTGVLGIDLAGIVSLVPAFTPFRSQLPRVGSDNGAKVTQWRALLNVTNQQPSIFVGFDNAGSLVVVDEQDVFSPYAPIALAGQVTQDAVDIAKGYADAKALETMNVLNMCMVKEDQALGTGAQAFALPAIGTVVVSNGAQPNGPFTAGNTGGSIAASTTVHVKCAARSGYNYFNGGSGVASADATGATLAGTATNTVAAFVPAVKGAVAYDWYVGTSSSNQQYYTTTTVNAVLITAIPGTPNPLPTYELPDLFGTAPTTPPVTDTSFSTNCFNSLLATILGDYGTTSIVTPGTGTPSGAQWTSMDGAKLTISGSSVAQLDALNLSIYNSVKLSPTAYMMNAQQASDLSSLILGTNLAVTYLTGDDPSRSNLLAGGYVGTYLNKAYSGAKIRIEVHPSVPPGTIIARTDSVPFPGSNIGNVHEVRTLRDYAQYPYGTPRLPSAGPSGPREEFEVRSIETLVNKAPVAHAVLSNIGAAE